MSDQIHCSQKDVRVRHVSWNKDELLNVPIEVGLDVSGHLRCTQDVRDSQVAGDELLEITHLSLLSYQ